MEVMHIGASESWMLSFCGDLVVPCMKNWALSGSLAAMHASSDCNRTDMFGDREVVLSSDKTSGVLLFNSVLPTRGNSPLIVYR